MKVLLSLTFLLSIVSFANASDEGQVNSMVSSAKTHCSHARTTSPKVAKEEEGVEGVENSAADSVSN